MQIYSVIQPIGTWSVVLLHLHPPLLKACVFGDLHITGTVREPQTQLG